MRCVVQIRNGAGTFVGKHLVGEFLVSPEISQQAFVRQVALILLVVVGFLSELRYPLVDYTGNKYCGRFMTVLTLSWTSGFAPR